MRVLNLFATGLTEVLLESHDDGIDVFLTKADYCSIVDDHVRKKSICLFILVNLVSFVNDFLAAFVAPLEARHGNNTDKHNRAAGDRRKCHLPAEKTRDDEPNDESHASLNDRGYRLRRHSIQWGDISREHVSQDAWGAVFTIEPLYLLEADSSHQIPTHIVSQVLTGHAKHGFLEAGDWSYNEYQNEPLPKQLVSFFDPVRIVGAADQSQLDFG